VPAAGEACGVDRVRLVGELDLHDGLLERSAVIGEAESGGEDPDSEAMPHATTVGEGATRVDVLRGGRSSYRGVFATIGGDMNLGEQLRTIIIEPIELATYEPDDAATEAAIPEPGPQPMPARASN